MSCAWMMEISGTVMELPRIALYVFRPLTLPTNSIMSSYLTPGSQLSLLDVTRFNSQTLPSESFLGPRTDRPLFPFLGCRRSIHSYPCVAYIQIVSAGGVGHTPGLSTGRLGRRCPAYGVQYQPRHLVRVAIGVGPPVLNIPFAVLMDLPGDSNGRPPVRHSIPKFPVGADLVETGQAFLDSMAIVGYVLLVVAPEGLSGGHARLVALAHLHGGILKKCVNSQAVYPLSEQHGLKARERRYTAHEEGKH